MDWNDFLEDYQGNPEEHIAIIGMAGRFPGAGSVDSFWENLKEGRESITFFTREQLEKTNLEKRLLNDSRFVGADGVIEDMDMFDAEFFGFSPREAEITDPQHRLFLECAWELMENAGYDSEHYTGRVGVYASANLSTYLLRNLMANPELRSQATSFQTVLGNDKDFIATRVSYKLNLKGPSVNVATLCSSSAVAIHLACQSLLTFQCDMALAGAVSLQASPNEAFFYQEGGIGSADGHCRAFDSEASGTVSGSGLGLVALRRLEDAVKDGDNILAIIRGTALNNDGANKMSFTAPGMEGQVGVIAEALNLAEVAPDTVSYVEAHGMGTPLGDPMEIEALTKAFRLSTEKKGYCAIGSVKTNIGHLVNAGGVAGLIKTVLSLKNKQIPASLNYRSPNPRIRFEDSPFYVNTRLSEWKTGPAPRRAGVNSFGIGGTNVHMILEEAPQNTASGSARQWQLLPLSARNEEALRQKIQNLKGCLSQETQLNAADVAYTLQVGRRSFPHRAFLVCRDTEEAVRIIDNSSENKIFTCLQENREQPVAFLLDGLTAPLPEAFVKELYEREPGFKKAMDACISIIEDIMHYDLRKQLYDESAGDEGNNAGSLDRVEAFAAQYAMAALWLEWGIMPRAVMGLDWLGKCMAACAAGSLSLEDAIAAAAAGSFGAVGGLELKPAGIPVISGKDGTLMGEQDILNPEYWDSPEETLSAGSLKTLPGSFHYIFLEIGCGRAEFQNKENTILSPVIPASFDSTASEEALLTTLGKLWLAGAAVNWNGLHMHQHRHRLPLPTYPFQRKHFWIEPAPENKAEVREMQAAALTYHERPVLPTEYTAPRNDTEAELAHVWQELMGIKPIGVFDSFIQLGGHSLLAAQVISRVRELFQIDVPLNQIFEEPTIANVAAYIDAVRWAAAGTETAAAMEIREEGEL
ncbi:phthiocerol synthesis polyketide synthase type I PpsE [Ruminiclostridium hungatei]|uniref:Phenolphthiocerol/phthiocerol polyketide synthase subunit E n=1 Tax=Ruminiclostridium hungatei TaxID=48256 RepID=A0A1V4SET0_RUMHU|nr:type I polyketide synthase [Ruminiclostridium hungatei]OPX42334.1 phthiocerol synthesis polyketide synthase type I PpsE [Ruminiclostridium hungatei]